MTHTGRQQVYVIQHELGPVKIGIADDPEDRLGQLQTGCPFELRLRQTKTPRDAEKVERYLHQRFKKYHMRGEWFDIPKKDLGFEIPSHMKRRGVPSDHVAISEHRDMTTEWARLLDRIVQAFSETRHRTPDLKDVRDGWRDLVDDLGGDAGEEDLHGPGDFQEVQRDTPKGLVRCSSCGFTYQRTDDGCSTCGSGSYTDRQGFR